VNALKRFEEEKGAARARGVTKSVEAFLPAMDSLARAEATGEIPDAFQGIAKQLHDAAKSLGMVQFGSIGEAFDPNLHEALGQDAVASLEEDDTVTAVLEPGWKAGDVVVRPAKVRVAHFEG
jgi:molecular chaperone GrpE